MQRVTNQTQSLLQLIAGKWTTSVIYALRHGALRYSAVEKALPSITQRALTNTLRNLERNGMVERRSYPTIPPQVEYKLTPLGQELFRLCETLSDWAQRHEVEIRQAQKAYSGSTPSPCFL